MGLITWLIFEALAGRLASLVGFALGVTVGSPLTAILGALRVSSLWGLPTRSRGV